MEAVIEKTVQFVKDVLANAEGGHDWWHIYRVWNNAKQIAQHEDVDLLIVELGALLHDIADSKFHNGDEEVGPKRAREFLQSLAVDEAVIGHVEKIIRNISFKGEKNVQVFKSPELDVVQDADRLDALGAIGIARAFSYGGHKNRRLYDPTCKPQRGMTKEEYRKNEGTTINHFYEKLLLLKDRMNTNTGKKLANERHGFMEQFLEQFHKEWGKDSEPVPSKLFFASTNKAKLDQFRFVADKVKANVTIDSVYQAFPEVKSYSEEYATQEEIVINGAKEMFNQIRQPVVVEDSILEVDILGGMPGLKSNTYLKQKGVQGLLADLEGKEKSARIISIVGFHDGKDVHLFKTVVEGEISQPAFKHGEPSWVGPTFHPFGGGFNQVFKIKTGKTLAEHTAEDGLELGYREPNFRRVLEQLKLR